MIQTKDRAFSLSSIRCCSTLSPKFQIYFEFHLVQILTLKFMLIFTFLAQEPNFKCKENVLNNVFTVYPSCLSYLRTVQICPCISCETQYKFKACGRKASQHVAVFLVFLHKSFCSQKKLKRSERCEKPKKSTQLFQIINYSDKGQNSFQFI